MHATSFTKPRARVSWSADERAEWLRLFNESGQTAADFARDNDLSPATLSFWRQQLIATPASDACLVEVPRETVSAATPAPSTAVVTVQLPSGLRFEVPIGLDTAWFGRLLQALVDARV